MRLPVRPSTDGTEALATKICAALALRTGCDHQSGFLLNEEGEQPAIERGLSASSRTTLSALGVVLRGSAIGIGLRIGGGCI